VLVASLLVACGGAPAAAPASAPAAAPAAAAISMSSLPVFTGATEEASDNLTAMLDSLVTGFKGESGVKNAEGKAYTVPEGTTWDAVKAFYTEALGKAGWAAGESAENAAAYSQGNYALIIKFAPADTGYIVALSEAK
jgi:hypothetical protein